MKKITVIVRVYNNTQYIKIALNSVLNQDISKNLYDILIIDDGSDIKTKKLLREYKDKITIVHTPHLGIAHAANTGFKLSTTDYVILLDSDDYYIPTLLKDMIDIIEKEETDFVVSDYLEIQGIDIRYISLKNNIFNGGGNGILMRKKPIEKLGYLDESFLLPEYKLLYYLEKGYRYSYIQKPLIVHRKHLNSVTDNKDTINNGIKQLKVIYGKDISKVRKC